MEISNYLGVTLNLNDGSYCPYRKLNDETNYIHVNSDLPSSILKQLLMPIEERSSSSSSFKKFFKETVPHYEQYLSNCGYKEKLNYRDPISLNLIKKANDKEKFYGSTQPIVRQSNQKLVSSFYS